MIVLIDSLSPNYIDTSTLDGGLRFEMVSWDVNYKIVLDVFNTLSGKLIWEGADISMGGILERIKTDIETNMKLMT